MKKRILLLMTMVVVLFLAACGTADNGETEDAETADEGSESNETVTENHELGETEVEKNPENVVVFDFGILDTLDELGVEVDGAVQSSTVPSYLEKYEGDDYENIGILKEPDFE